MGNDTYLSNSDVIKKLDDLSTAVGGTAVPTTTTKTNTDFVIGINKSIDAASGRTGVEYPPYSHNTLVTDKLDELAEAIAEGGGGGPGPTPVMGALSVTENGDYLPASYNYDGFSSVNVDVPTPPAPVMGTLSVTENGDYLPSSYNYDGFSSVSVEVPEPTPTETIQMIGSNGAQRLTLPYYADDGISIEFKMMLSTNSSNRVILGDLFDYDGTVLYTVGTNAALGARTQQEWFAENLPYKSWTMVDVKLDIANGIFTIDGVNYGTGHVPTTHPANTYLTLFDTYGGGRGSSVAIGEVSIKQNNAEVMHLVPMKNSQTGAGYYHDSIGDQDYYSEGSTDFAYIEFGSAPGPTPVTPEFTETILWYTGSSEQTISLSDDYHNYDFVRFEFWNRSGQYSWDVVTTPSSLDKIWSLDTGVCFNEFSNNQYWYGTYDDTTYTFTRVNYRNTYFTKVVGLVCNNFTMTEDVIYSAPARSSNDVTISTDKNLYNYYALMVVANGPYDEIIPCYLSIDPHTDDHLPEVQQTIHKYIDPVHLIAPPSIRYNCINPYASSQAVTITDDGYGLSSARYAYVTGIKFT